MPDRYIKELENQNEELMNRLAIAETLIKKINRKKSVYPVFKLIKRQIVSNMWVVDCEYLTNCDDVKLIIPTVKYTLNYHKSENGELIGFQYWRQSLNYRWALTGMSKFLDLNLKRVGNIEVDSKTGEVFHPIDI